MTSSENKPTSEQVYNQFDAKEYLIRRYSDPHDKERGVQPFLMQCIYDFYRNFHSQLDPTKVQLLEFGGGPVIYSLISPTPHVAEVTFSDYSENSLKEVLLWKRKDPQAHDWSPYFKYVVNTLEGSTNPDAASQREEELRSKVQAIIPCNIKAEDVLLGRVAPEKRLFDIVSSNFCMEAVCESISEYEGSIRKLKELIKPGGFLTSLVSTEESMYVYGNKWFSNHLYVTQQDIHDCHRKAGFVIRDSAHFDIPIAAQNVLNDCKGIHFIAAQKVAE